MRRRRLAALRRRPRAARAGRPGIRGGFCAELPIGAPHRENPVRVGGPDPVLLRVHSECLTGDAFGSLRCDCGPQLDAAMSLIQEVGWGCILYLRQEGRGIGLHAKIQAYNLQDQGADTVEANLLLGHPADARDYRVASEILGLIGIDSVCLLTNNPDKIGQLVSYGINVEQRMPLVAGVGDENREYLAIKVDKMGHDIASEDLNRST